MRFAPFFREGRGCACASSMADGCRSEEVQTAARVEGWGQGEGEDVRREGLSERVGDGVEV